MKTAIHCFKPYDIRGRIPDQLNDDIAYRIGRAYALWLKPKNVVVGYDIRLTSESLCNAVTQGLLDCGVDVINIGQCGIFVNWVVSNMNVVSAHQLRRREEEIKSVWRVYHIAND